MPDSSDALKQQTPEPTDVLDTASEPEGELTSVQLGSVVGGTTPLQPLSNPVNIRHEALKAVIQNIRA